MSQAPRRINTDRSLNRPDQAAKAAPRPAAGTTGTSGRPAAGSTSGSGRSAPPRHSAQPARQVEPPRRRKKKKKTPLWLPFAVVMAVIAVVSGVVVYGVSMLNKVEDSLRPDDSTPTIQEEVKTAEEYKGDVVNILVCGIDYEEGRNYSDASSNDGMTDMILYCQFDIKTGALHMLQIPRNSLVTTKNPRLEDKQTIIARIHEAARYIPLDRLCLSPQCGFASCEIGNKLTEMQQWAKLALVKEIAEEVWGK